MLTSFRKASQTWVVKILFGLLSLTFVGWGVGDMIRFRSSSQYGIKVGDEKISPQEVTEDFRRQAQQMQRQFGGKVSIDQLRMLILPQTIEGIVRESLLDQEGKRLGLTVDDATLRKAIAALPYFQGQNGFDPDLYHRALQANGLSEQRFERQERQNMTRAQLADMVAAGTSAPDALAEPIYRYRHEQRVAELIPFAATAMPAPAAPSEDVLRAYHKDHAAPFTAPEMRALTFVAVHASDLVADYKPTDAQIAKAYQDRQSEFTTAETRHLQQVFLSDKDSAQKLADAIKGGQSIADAAKAAGKTVDDLGNVERRSLPIEAIAEATFATPVPGVVGPIQTPLGWNVFYVSDQQAGKVRPLAEVRDQVVAGLAKEEAGNRLTALSNKVSDALGSGAPLEEVANTANLKLVKVKAVDSSGKGPDGQPVTDLPKAGAQAIGPFMETAFATAKGSTSDITDLGNDGFFIVRVDDVTPPALKPFETVKDQVLAAWTLEQQKDAAQKAATAAVERLNKGEDTGAVAGAIKVDITQPFTRSGSDTVPAPVAAAAFQLEVGKAATAVAGDTSYAVRLAKIVPADPKADPAGLAEERQQLDRSIAGDLSQQYVTALAKDIGVKINQQAIDAQFGQQ